MRFLLPLIMEQLRDADSNISTKALVVLRHVVHVTGEETVASIAPQLSAELLLLFDADAVQVRVLSTRLFRDVLAIMLGTKDQQLQKQVRSSLLPLLFHMEDESCSVRQASREALLRAAKFLKWKQLRQLVETAQTWRIGECLLVRARRAEEYLHQSLTYLESPQESLREAAVRFTGLVGQHLRGRSKEKLEDICTALQGLQEDSSPSVCCLATQTILLLRAPGKMTPSPGTHQGPQPPGAPEHHLGGQKQQQPEWLVSAISKRLPPCEHCHSGGAGG
ncbi:maestro heat-like repeat-containing protein family member 7 [Dromaius novaehollandiae]|uniref:maestro heat-like repeat-containing protein family member 7 n=1 Tax=Dromaius novaehollandiae TaxID=8790 RepID=UPI00311EC5BA